MSIDFCVQVSKIGQEFSFLPPKSLRDACESLWSARKPKEGLPYLSIKLSIPRKPRSTGEKSQNNCIHGYATQIANYTGDYTDRIKHIAKIRAFRRGYPPKRDQQGNIMTGIDGEPIPESTANISTVEAGYLIDELIHIAAEIDLKLEES